MSIPSLLLTVSTTVCLFAPPALAQPADSPPAEESYRGWVAGTSAAALGFYVLGALSEEDGGRDTAATGPLFAAGMIGLTLSGPVVHGLHDQWKAAGSSLLLRLALPGVGMSLAIAARGDCDELLCELDYVGYGYLAGAVAAVAVDTVWLGTRIEHERPPRAAPYAAATGSGGLVGLTGTF